MNSQQRYNNSYGVPERSYLDHGTPPETAQEAALVARRRAYRVRVTEDAFVWRILLGIAVVAGCFALAVFLGKVPVPAWLTK